MTIHTLTLKNFRQHEDRTITFTKGLNVIRGANEAGKTTLLEAMLYAWFGSTCLRDPLAEVVTWGKKETELKVSLVATIQDTTYTFTRSKGGAECTYGDKRVVGQKEVSAFAAQLLGADAKTAGLLMMAGQSSLRGALDEGPSAVSGLMGRLADFDMIDRILTNAESKLLLGSNIPLQTKLGQAEAELATLREAVPDVSAARALEQQIQLARPKVETLERELAACIAPRRDQAEAAYNRAVAAERRREELAGQIQNLDRNISRVQSEIEQARQTAPRPSDTELAGARAAAQAASEAQRNRQAILAARSMFDSMPAYPEVFWDQDADSFAAELERAGAEMRSLQSQRSELGGQIRQLSGQSIKGGKCPTCGQATVDPDHMARHNAEIDAKIRDLQAKDGELAKSLAAADGDFRALGAIESFARHQRTLLQGTLGNFVKLDLSNYPPRVSWAGPEVPEPGDATAAQTLRRLEDAARAADVAAGRITALEQTLEQTRQQRSVVQHDLDGLTLADLPACTAEYDAASRIHLNQVTEINTLKAEIADAEAQLSTIRQTEALAKQRVESVQARIAEYNKDLSELSFNNDLMAKLRKLKPAITDHLWNTVLAAVSSFFSTLRGEESIVTKDGDGFKVNGRSKDSLSGSTIDVLALAIRVALTKTFIPHAALMTLDEPAHGCDLQRTSSVLGFLSSIGLDQVILASHDELSESVADNLIQLST